MMGFVPGHRSSFQAWAHLRHYLDFDYSIGQKFEKNISMNYKRKITIL
jgi:hypothetical protein